MLELECVDTVNVYYAGKTPSTFLLQTRCDVCGSEMEEVELTYDDVCKMKKYMEKHKFMNTPAERKSRGYV
jgi:hypothetical protein